MMLTCRGWQRLARNRRVWTRSLGLPPLVSVSSNGFATNWRGVAPGGPKKSSNSSVRPIEIRRVDTAVSGFETVPTSAVGNTIVLTMEDEYLFEFLLDVARMYSPDTQLRLSGGWVRDRLMGVTKPGHDIDVLVDNISGAEFSRFVNKYEIKQGRNRSRRSVLRNTRNRSDFVPVTIMHLLGFEVDFANFRLPRASIADESQLTNSSTHKNNKNTTSSDQSSESSMDIQEMVKQDAMQRDFTVNALFYNLNEEHIEDFTERGLEDLKNRILRTPQEAKDTLLFSPSRALRAIRFACKYGFEMEPSLWAAVQDREVRAAIYQGVTRYRIGIEFEEMMTSQDPVRGLRLLMQSGLLEVVFRHEQETPQPINPLNTPWTQEQQDKTLSRLGFLRNMQKKNLTIHEALAAIASAFCPPMPRSKQLLEQAIPTPKASSNPLAWVDVISSNEENTEAVDRLVAKLDQYDARHTMRIQGVPRESIATFVSLELRRRQKDAKRVLQILNAAHCFPGLTAESEHQQEDLDLELARWMKCHRDCWEDALNLLLCEASEPMGVDPTRMEAVRERKTQIKAYLESLADRPVADRVYCSTTSQTSGRGSLGKRPEQQRSQ